MKNVSIIGLGYVGLPLALLTAEKGFNVTGIDLNKSLVNKINNRVDPIGEDFISQRLTSTTLRASETYDSIKTSDVVIVCVPTPVKNGNEPDLGPVRSAVTSIAHKLTPGTLVIIESTINPGVCDEVVIPLLEQESKLKVNKGFYLSHCPERINPGDLKWNVSNIPRVVGSSSSSGLEKTLVFYKQVVDAQIKPMGSLKEAEACKVVENSFRDINIAFVNELAKSFTKLGINVKNVIDGAATKPFAFMPHYPSIGVGGHCIPVDPYYLIEYARGYGFEHEFLSLARSINNSMPEFTVERLADGLNEVGKAIKGSTVTVLGLSYKADVADDRESPSYDVIDILKDKGANIKTYDPFIRSKSSENNLESALKDIDAVIVACNHTEFLSIDFVKHKVKVLVDGKNALSKFSDNRSIIYRGIGVI